MTERPCWYECEGLIVCQDCRSSLLKQWAPGSQISEDEVLRSENFTPLGRTPWAGNPSGERYMQCDNCQQQWGPDA